MVIVPSQELKRTWIKEKLTEMKMGKGIPQTKRACSGYHI